MKYIFLLLFICNLATAQLQINEVCSDNDELYAANNGNYYDWVEIYNSSDLPIQLSDYYLSDDDSKLKKWNFNPEILQAKSYVIVFASDLKNTPEQQHANFKLSSKGESIYLSNSQGLIDSITFGPINEDYSYGRLEESSSIKTHLALPTPGTSNTGSGTVISNYESGFYDKEFDLELTAAQGLKIYYTTNGDDPTLESKLYDGKLKIKDEYEDYEYLNVPTTPDDSLGCSLSWKKVETEIPRCKVVSYCIINSSGKKGRTYRKSYFLNNNHKLPIVSIVTDNMSLFSQDTGIYVPGNLFDLNNACWSGNYFVKSWERSASLTYFENRKKILDENAGIKINGGGTRNLPQKSIKFFARKKYGINKFDNVFFPDFEMKEFNSLVIRTTMADWSETLFKDALTLEIVRNLNLEPTYSKPIVVYINGVYWGLSELRNRLDEDFLAEKYSVSQDSINVIHPTNPKVVNNGSYDDFAPIYDFILNNDLSVTQNYEYVESRIDLDNLIDYYITEMYFNNYDWPGNNFMIWNSMELDKKYRALLYDLDGGWSRQSHNMFEHTAQLEHDDWPNPRSTNIIQQKLLSNELFKSKFIDRTLYLLENDFKFKKIKPLIEKYLSQYESEIENTILRFEFLESKAKWLSEVENNLTVFARERECYYRQHLVEHFDLDPNLLCNPTSVNASDSQTFTISPNPANDLIILDNINSNKVEIFSLEGTKIMEIPSLGLNKVEINISNLSPSVYFARTDNKTMKFVVIK